MGHGHVRGYLPQKIRCAGIEIAAAGEHAHEGFQQGLRGKGKGVAPGHVPEALNLQLILRDEAFFQFAPVAGVDFVIDLGKIRIGNARPVRHGLNGPAFRPVKIEEGVIRVDQQRLIPHKLTPFLKKRLSARPGLCPHIRRLGGSLLSVCSPLLPLSAALGRPDLLLGRTMLAATLHGLRGSFRLRLASTCNHGRGQPLFYYRRNRRFRQVRRALSWASTC